MNQISLQPIIDLISTNIGFHIKNKERNLFESIIKDRLAALNYRDSLDYFNLLQTSQNNDNVVSWKQQIKGQQEWNILTNKLTNGESFFFAIQDNLNF